MTNINAKRWWLVAGVVTLALLAMGIVGFHFAQKALKEQIVQALGPESEVRAIELGWSNVQVIGLRIHGPRGWPTGDALRAERITVVPDLRSLFSATYRVSSITIDEPYLSAVRAKDGRLRVLPSLIEQPVRKGEKKASAAPAVFIGKVKLRDAVLEFFDATVRQPPLKLRLEQMQATVDDLQLPALLGRTQLQLEGVLKGAQRDGTISIVGWAEIATKDSSLTTKLHGVDLVSLEPYLIKTSEAGVRRGKLDLDVKSTVSRNRLRAPGAVTLSGLELSNANGTWGTYMGVPRQAVVAFLKNQNDQIAVKFILEGDINDPKFSLNENISTRIASSMAETLGVSLKNMVGGVGTVGQKGVDAAGKAAGGLGSALGKLFGK